ncbi:MAG: hypothetical protein ABIG46_00695 [Candidatus Omnitrophota bacterium]|nr:hypothetical protein [Candidatus Omnitrophota bacterium]
MKNSQAKKAQAVAEYVLILSVVLVALIASAFIAKSRGAFNTAFDTAAGKITGNR